MSESNTPPEKPKRPPPPATPIPGGGQPIRERSERRSDDLVSFFQARPSTGAVVELQNRGAIRLEKLPVDLTSVRSIYTSLVSELRTPEAETFIAYPCEYGNNTVRWLIVRTPPQVLSSYLVGHISFRSMIEECRDKFVYIIEADSKQSYRQAWFAAVVQLPQTYIPGPNSYHPQELVVQNGYQDVYVNQKWGYEEVSDYPRKYLQAYAFNAVFGPGGEESALTLDYNLTTGWIFHTLFERMRVSMPRKKRASLDAVTFASPGYLRFIVDSNIANGLIATIAAYISRAAEINSARNELSSWYNGHVEVSEDGAKAIILWICDALGVNGKSLLAHTNTVHNAAKIIVSYVNRISFLAQNEVSGSALLVGFRL